MKKIDDFLSLSSSERKGVIVLLVIIVILVIIRLFQAFQLNDFEFPDPLPIQGEMATIAGDTNFNAYPEELIEETEDEAGQLFYFDPNTADESALRQLGFSTSQIRNVVRYRTHGGIFRTRKDLLRIYTLDKAFYLKLEPYIHITAIDSLQESRKTDKVFLKTPMDINTADSAMLISVKGIGPVFSRRIIRYRKRLGGFYSMAQLGEVYGLADSIIDRMKGAFYADTAIIKKININTASEAEMAGHPYIGKYAARGIILYREKIHLFSNTLELKNQGIITGEAFERAKKYLVI